LFAFFVSMQGLMILRKSFLLLWCVAILWSVPGLSQQSCLGIFTFSDPSSISISSPSESKNPYSFLFSALEKSTVGNEIQVINKAILQIARMSGQKERIAAFIEELKYLEAKMINHVGARGNMYFVRDTIYLLRLINDTDLVYWKSILINEKALSRLLQFNNFGTMGYLLELLPPEKKLELVAYLGGEYAKEKNHAVVQPIHLLLNPKKIYDEFKQQGRSDFEFYETYLDLIHRRAFAGKNVGIYPPELILQIIGLIQKDVLHDGIHAVNFFGSVPNGFGKATSDLDIFNSPLSPREIEKRVEAHIMETYDNERHQIVDRNFENDISTLLRNTPWQWHTHETHALPPEDFGGRAHVFSFHITKDKVVLRFYYQPLHHKEDGSMIIRDFIELDVMTH
jgi:predicted nucleotidyltransferase